MQGILGIGMNRTTTQLDAPHPTGGYDEIRDYPDGRRCYLLDGLFHRLDGPSFIGADGHTVWHKHGLEHRTDGPAIQYPDGTEEYWAGGVNVSPRTVGKSRKEQAHRGATGSILRRSLGPHSAQR